MGEASPEISVGADDANMEEAQLLRELDELETKLAEKEANLRGIAERESALREEFAATKVEARSLSLTIAKLEEPTAGIPPGSKDMESASARSSPSTPGLTLPPR